MRPEWRVSLRDKNGTWDLVVVAWTRDEARREAVFLAPASRVVAVKPEVEK